MNKFKFGDKVLHDIEPVGFGVVISTENGESYVAFKSGTMDWFSDAELTPASDWVKCSERMPEFDDVNSPITEYFVATTSEDGDEVQRAYYIEWRKKECKWVSLNGVPIRTKATHWMLSITPALPKE